MKTSIIASALALSVTVATAAVAAAVPQAPPPPSILTLQEPKQQNYMQALIQRLQESIREKAALEDKLLEANAQIGAARDQVAALEKERAELKQQVEKLEKPEKKDQKDQKDQPAAAQPVQPATPAQPAQPATPPVAPEPAAAAKSVP